MSQKDTREMMKRMNVSRDSGCWFETEWYLRDAYLSHASDAGFAREQVIASFDTLKAVFDPDWMRARVADEIRKARSKNPRESRSSRARHYLKKE